MTSCAIYSGWSLAGIIVAVYVISFVAGWVARRMVAEDLAGSRPER